MGEVNTTRDVVCACVRCSVGLDLYGVEGGGEKQRSRKMRWRGAGAMSVTPFSISWVVLSVSDLIANLFNCGDDRQDFSAAPYLVIMHTVLRTSSKELCSANLRCFFVAMMFSSGSVYSSLGNADISKMICHLISIFVWISLVPQLAGNVS